MADNVISMLPGGMPSCALDALKNNQRQLDFDGCEVGVSRQALDEIIAAYEALSARVAGEASVTGAEGWRTMAEVSLSIASEVRRRNRIGEEGERHSIAPACEGAAADLVLAALTSCGFAVVPAALDRKGGKDA